MPDLKIRVDSLSYIDLAGWQLFDGCKLKVFFRDTVQGSSRGIERHASNTTEQRLIQTDGL